MNYDVIGDIHGDSARLHALLRRLGYREDAAGFAAPAGHQAVFLGDLIDRGPGQLEVLDVVRRLVDRGDAHCVMGNHELNAIGWVTPRDEGGGFLRAHTAHRCDQHAAFLSAVGEGSARHREWIDWFRTLPVALDLGGIRAVHAWWHDGHVATAAAAGPRPLAGERLHEALDRRTALGVAIDGLTKGYEVALPDGARFVDKEGHERREVRTQWWRDGSRTYREAAIIEDAQRHAIPDVPLPDHYRATPVRGAPVFVGHYWLSGEVTRRDPKVACLDFSGAKGGPLVAYQWRGEPEVRDEAFLQVATA